MLRCCWFDFVMLSFRVFLVWVLIRLGACSTVWVLWVVLLLGVVCFFVTLVWLVSLLCMISC